MVTRWKDYIDRGVFSLSVSMDTVLGGGGMAMPAEFWTSPWPYWQMKNRAHELFQSLVESDLVVFKVGKPLMLIELNWQSGDQGDLKWVQFIYINILTIDGLCKLSQVSLCILSVTTIQGNPRLTGDARWPAWTTFASAIGKRLHLHHNLATGILSGPLAGSFPLLSLRTNKADVVVGVKKELVEQLDNSGERWRVNGR